MILMHKHMIPIWISAGVLVLYWCWIFGFYPQDIEILGWCPAGPVLPHREKLPL